MKITKVLTGILMLVLFFSCKTTKVTQTEKSKLDSTAERSKQTAKEMAMLQKVEDKRLDSLNSDEQNDLEWEMFMTQTPTLDSNGKNIGNTTHAYIKGKAKTVKKKNKKSQQTTNGTTAAKANETNNETDKAAVKKVETTNNKNKTTTGGWGWLLKLCGIIAIVLFVWILIVIVKRRIKKKLEALPLPLLLIAILLFAACGQKVEAPTVAVASVEIKQPEPVKLTLLDIAKQEIGKKEQPIGSNWGPDVQKYLKSVDLTSSNPWCMAFIYWTVQEYCNQYGYINPLFKTGHVKTEWYKCKSLWVKKGEEVKPGDIFIIINPDGTGHCGFVVKVVGDTLYTIEGNTNKDGSRNGYMVCERQRSKKSVTGYIRPVFKK